MPRLIDFPGCCTAKILTGFGQSDTAEYAYRPAHGMTFEQMYAECESMIEVQKRGGRVALIFATTNSDQKMGEQVLEKLGFQRTLEVSKTQHSDKTVTGWWVDVGNAEYRAKKAPKASGANWGDIAKQAVADAPAIPDAIGDQLIVEDVNAFQVHAAPVFGEITQRLWESLVVPQAARDAVINALNADGDPDFIGAHSYRRIGVWRQQRNRLHDPAAFRNGDRVRVMSKAPANEGGWDNVWIGPMDDCVGAVGTVRVSNQEGVAIQFEDDQNVWDMFYFPSFVLRKYL